MKIMKMKGKTNRDFDMDIIKSERPLLPEQNDEYRTVAGRDGQEHFAKELGNTQLRVRFFKTNFSPEKWVKDRRDIVGWLYSKNEVRIEFDDEPGVHYIGKVTETDVPEDYKPAVYFWITLTMHPFRYGEPKAEILTFDDEDVAIVESNGTYETPYVMTIEAQSGANELVFTLNGYEITYDGAISNGSIITIDTNELELRINGELKVIEVDGYFMFLESGVNQITSSVDGIHTIVFTERSL